MASVIILMGVSGCGKTTSVKKVDSQLQLPFFEGDDFHLVTNITKMEQQIPLNDEDQKPWLHTLTENLNKGVETSGAVLASFSNPRSYSF